MNVSYQYLTNGWLASVVVRDVHVDQKIAGLTPGCGRAACTYLPSEA